MGEAKHKQSATQKPSRITIGSRLPLVNLFVLVISQKQSGNMPWSL
jgi:hypothetical protein